ncbi:hypothetical protein E2562_028073 [Oryza meyeriana var. granulata]|uniref:Uncharacterized protein n=1 Tax=Oryza meyeriana var. granulata TaxID=110450 RepID=A0A6G1C0L5_9ORYZ|nr:hypothetical protein E2562_028073 [Oryza meyeriana var. granulata]
MLQLEEQRIAESEKMQAAAALVAQAAATGSPSSAPSSATPSAAHLQSASALVAHSVPGTPTSQGAHGKIPATTSTPPAPNNSGRPSTSSSSNKKKKKKGAPSNQAPQPGFWPTMNPWTGMVQAWPFQKIGSARIS